MGKFSLWFLIRSANPRAFRPGIGICGIDFASGREPQTLVRGAPLVILAFCFLLTCPQPLLVAEEAPPGVAKQERIPGKGLHKGWETGKHKGWDKAKERKRESTGEKKENKEKVEEKALKEKRQESREMKRMPEKMEGRVEKESVREGRHTHTDMMEHHTGHTAGAGHGRGR